MVASRPTGILLAVLVGLSACGSPKQDEGPQRVQDQQDRELLQQEPGPRPLVRWENAAPPMPESFNGFVAPTLSDLDGHWLVPSEIPGRRELWVIDSAQRVLTVVDHRGRERHYGLAILTPCSLRLTDERGRARTRLFARDDSDAITISTGGAVGLSDAQGGFLVCVGTRNYRLSADGSCTLHTEMLGVWEQREAKAEHCRHEKLEDGSRLFMDDETLEQRGQLWLDPIAAAAKAQRVADRKAGETILAAEPAQVAPDAGGSETGGSETGGSETGGSETTSA
ncbi:MAG: hypothetical protein KC431_15480 [Myxococcales bacterium]|nr:hypothetical protein [Myxococcales bacterium]